MVGRIPRTFISSLLAHTDIVELIDARFKLKKQGKHFIACCPFHNDKIPSFHVSSKMQFYHCFSCGSHGNAIDFLMNYDRLGFLESLEELAIRCGWNIPYENNDILNAPQLYSRQRLYDLMEKISIFYQQSLHEQALVVNSYLQQRGLNATVINDFAIGFAPPGWDNVIKYFGHSAEAIALLKATGMVVYNDNGNTYDLFRNRIMFPIRDKRGHIIAFGGRLLGEGQPKYINSPASDLFHKSNQLYGLYEAQQKNANLSKLLVVEGYMDVVTLAQFGINYVVASLGTATTTEQIQLLYRTTDQLICCYDGDRAGREAAWKTLENALPYLIDKRQLRFMFLSNSQDPDTIIRKIGKEAFEKYIEQAQPLSEFLFDTLMQQVNLSNLDDRVKLIALALPLINKIPNGIWRLFLRQLLANRVGILDDNKLEKLLQLNKKRVKSQQNLRIKCTPIHILIGLLVQNPWLSTLAKRISNKLEQARQPGVKIFIQLVKTCQKEPSLTTGQLLELYRHNKFYAQLETFATWNHMIIEDLIERTFIDALTKLYNSILEQRQDILIALDRKHGLTTEERKELWYLNQALAKKDQLSIAFYDDFIIN
ncbi:DNA primase [Candidatus Palibaumannia cicadellinicola]|uniref:DNA primase n=1 Tax=Baumannia cicadellinicola subsp. Homalodisca coagulata TaxID=374463 RepID=Q1LSM2_BAUCH|nr:DNA primase [Candidatus Baumannia cicadellinicola]ABF13869.1 DNA primase [Baumannia cicadellinicola str. Hc (Homalodisca coagulata)]MBS0032521.1 DNA primase [Candidatus Baumannia cicadellinicola]MCJ7461957.1 DNA primase [Candidatus Baumannia cicadellinicola]MCJ7462695.1 DNA primase [Candidatus Baumannia cicadellinicola]